jgi:RND family efflux transporter MFP subunit
VSRFNERALGLLRMSAKVSQSEGIVRQNRAVKVVDCLCVLLILSAVGVGCGSGSAASQGQQGPGGVPVKIQVVSSMPVSDASEYVATLKSRDSAVIMPEVEGRVTQIYAHSGDRVAPGTRLMQIDPIKQQATVTSQEGSKAAQLANLQYAEQQYQRTSSLYAAQVVSKQDLDQAKSALDAARAQLNALDAQLQEQQVQLHYFRVVAPQTGIVGDIPVHVGDRVTTTTVLTTVDKPGSLEAYIYVPVERAPQLRMNLPVEIVDSAGKVVADSRISFISPEVDNTTQSVLVKASVTNHQDKLRTLQFIRARIVWGTRSEPVVPVLAVSRVGGQYFAFVAEEQKGMLVAHQKPLTLGDMVGNDYAVLDGVKPGDKVVVSGTQFLVDGVPVIPQG